MISFKRIIAGVLAAVLCFVPAAAQVGPLSFGPTFVYVKPAIGTPASLGSTASNSGTTSATITTTASILAGDLVVISASFSCSASCPNTVSAVGDGTNTYSLGIAQTGSGNQRTELWYVANAAAVGSGATITVSFSGTSNGLILAAARVSGIISVPLDKTGVGPGTVTGTPTASTGTLSQPKEIVWGTFSSCCSTTSTGSGFTVPTGLSGLITGNTNISVDMAYKVVSATTSVDYSPTEGAHNEACVVASFKN